MEKQTQFNIGYVIIAIIAMLWIQSLWLQARTVQPITYSEFQGYLKDGKIEEISILASHIEGTFKQPLPDGRTRFVAVRVDPELARDLAQYNVKFAGVVQSRLLLEQGAQLLLQKETLAEEDLQPLRQQAAPGDSVHSESALKLE